MQYSWLVKVGYSTTALCWVPFYKHCTRGLHTRCWHAETQVCEVAVHPSLSHVYASACEDGSV